MPESVPASVAHPSLEFQNSRKCPEPSCRLYMKRVEQNKDHDVYQCTCSSKAYKLSKYEKTELVKLEFFPAQPSSQLLSQNESNSQYNKEKENELLLLYNESNSKKGRVARVELFRRVSNVSGKAVNVWRVYIHFLEKGCSFSKDLMKALGLTEPTTHRIINQLLEQEFIFPITKTNIPRKHGPKTTMYGVDDVSKEEIDKAIVKEFKYSSKNYVFVDQLYQRTLVEIERESIQFNKIVSLAKRQGKNNGFHFMDIADHVARKHTLNGVKVWK